MHPVFRLVLSVLVGGVSLLAGQQEEAAPRTIIESDSLELVTSEAVNRFYFRGNVRVTAANMTARCQEMEVVASRTAESDPDATIGEIGAIDKILASGSVVIEQAGRRAEAGRAEIFPREGKVILTESPRVTDERGVVATGPRMILEQGKRARIEGVEGQPDLERPRVILPTASIPDLDAGDAVNTTAAGETDTEGTAVPPAPGRSPADGDADSAANPEPTP